MNTTVMISALNMDLNSLLKSMDVIVLDCKDSLAGHNTYMFNTKKELDKNLNIWIKLSIRNKDPILSNATLTSIVSDFSDIDVFTKREDLWMEWTDIRKDAASHHGLTDPGDDASANDIVGWCSGVRHILSDSSRFEGMSAKVSGRTKILKLLKILNGAEGLTTLEEMWSIEEASLVDNLDIWLQSQKDLISIITGAATSKPKKDVLLYAKRLLKLNERKMELERLLISLDLWKSNIQKLLSHADTRITLDDFQWFTSCCRQWTVDVQKYCYDQDSKSKPDAKLMKVAFSKIKIRD